MEIEGKSDRRVYGLWGLVGDILMMADDGAGCGSFGSLGNFHFLLDDVSCNEVLLQDD